LRRRGRRRSGMVCMVEAVSGGSQMGPYIDSLMN